MAAQWDAAAPADTGTGVCASPQSDSAHVKPQPAEYAKGKYWKQRVPVLQDKNAILNKIKRITTSVCKKTATKNPWADDGSFDRARFKELMNADRLGGKQSQHQFLPHPDGHAFGAPFMQLVMHLLKTSGLSVDKVPYILALTHLLWTGKQPSISDIPMPQTVTDYLRVISSLDDEKWLQQVASIDSTFGYLIDESKRQHKANSALMLNGMERVAPHIYKPSSRLTDVTHLISTNESQTTKQVLRYLQGVSDRRKLRIDKLRTACNDHCSGAMAVARGVQAGARLMSANPGMAVPSTGESLHEMHLELQHVVEVLDGTNKPHWDEFSLSMFFTKLSWATKHDWSTVHAMLVKIEKREVEKFRAMMENSPESAFPAMVDKGTQVGEVATPSWQIPIPADHVLSRFGNLVGFPDGIVYWYARHKVALLEVARVCSLSRESHAHAAWQSLYAWMQLPECKAKCESVKSFASCYWRPFYAWNEAPGPDVVFAASAGEEPDTVLGMPGCRAAQRHHHLRQRWGRLTAMRHQHPPAGVDAAVWGKAMCAAQHGMHKLALTRWYSFPLLYACAMSTMGTHMIHAGLLRVAPDLLPESCRTVVSLQTLCIGALMDATDEWKAWPGLWEAPLLEEHRHRVVSGALPTEVPYPKTQRWIILNILGIRDNDQKLEGIFNIIDHALRHGMTWCTEQARVGLYVGDRMGQHLRSIVHPVHTSICEAKGEHHVQFLGQGCGMYATAITKKLCDKSTMTGPMVKGASNVHRTCRKNVKLYVQYAAEDAQRHTAQEIRAHWRVFKEICKVKEEERSSATDEYWNVQMKCADKAQKRAEETQRLQAMPGYAVAQSAINHFASDLKNMAVSVENMRAVLLECVELPVHVHVPRKTEELLQLFAKLIWCN